MQSVNIHEAKTHLSRLIEQAVKGEPFIIARAGVPLVKVSALNAPTPKPVQRLGFLRGEITVPDDFDQMGAEIIELRAEHETRKMTPELKTYINAWREVSPILEAMRDEELRNTPLPVAMAQLSSMIDSAIFLKPLSDTSGLVEMQRILSRLR